mmetsp:Transcript_29642/g.54397  ORF Transcript_29642/g.54397 Transcript_29642/m.54397 type:complete len:256 (-) Transcript_29642:317-1084(-)
MRHRTSTKNQSGVMVGLTFHYDDTSSSPPSHGINATNSASANCNNSLCPSLYASTDFARSNSSGVRFTVAAPAGDESPSFSHASARSDNCVREPNQSSFLVNTSCSISNSSSDTTGPSSTFSIPIKLSARYKSSGMTPPLHFGVLSGSSPHVSSWVSPSSSELVGSLRCSENGPRRRTWPSFSRRCGMECSFISAICASYTCTLPSASAVVSVLSLSLICPRILNPNTIPSTESKILFPVAKPYVARSSPFPLGP